MTDSYNDFAREASHRDLHNLAMGALNDSHQAARDVFNFMFKNGWYNLTSTTRQSLQQTKDQLPITRRNFLTVVKCIKSLRELLFVLDENPKTVSVLGFLVYAREK